MKRLLKSSGFHPGLFYFVAVVQMNEDKKEEKRKTISMENEKTYVNFSCYHEIFILKIINYYKVHIT